MLTPFSTHKRLICGKFGYFASKIQRTDYRTIAKNVSHGCSPDCPSSRTKKRAVFLNNYQYIKGPDHNHAGVENLPGCRVLDLFVVPPPGYIVLYVGYTPGSRRGISVGPGNYFQLIRR
jgi:hypothetical protein